MARGDSVIDWTKIDSRRHAEYCDAHGFRIVIEQTRWSPHPLDYLNQHRDEFEGFINSIRAGAWDDLDTAKREIVVLAARRAVRDHTQR
jgi:hypothetical protein